jgi:DNA-binding CsgD family transcriptional regulator
MPTRILPTSPELPSTSSRPGCDRSHNAATHEQTGIGGESSRKWMDAPRDSRNYSDQNCTQTKQTANSSPRDLFWTSLIDTLPRGVVVISRNLQLIYFNRQGKDLCQSLPNTEQRSFTLPSAVRELCHRLLNRDRDHSDPLVVECLNSQNQSIRLYATWFNPFPANHALSTEYILVQLENCHESLQEELRIERKKYDLTEREAEIWMLLRQECTYQTIAQSLQISLNTVKTHVKNLYAKKRSFQGQEKIVVF